MRVGLRWTLTANFQAGRTAWELEEREADRQTDAETFREQFLAVTSLSSGLIPTEAELWWLLGGP